MLAKRNVLTLWLVLVGIQWIIAGQTWYRVAYTFDGTEKTINTAGLNAWSGVNGLVMFGLVSAVAVMLTRGGVSRVVTAMVALASAAATAIVANGLGADVPPAVNGAVEKASGIAGGGPGGVSAAIDAVTGESALIWSFVAVAIVTVVVQILAAIGSKDWGSGPRVDKYSTRHEVRQPKATNPKTTETESSKSRNIELWDSQR
ncbi:MAG: Trp biosynthesis-associated membrane protein [Micrococcales bacterium]